MGNQPIPPGIREFVPATLPESATVAVVSDGQPELLDLGDRQGWHFPRASDGGWVGQPATDDDAIARLEEVRAHGAHYLFVPSTDFWWFDRYPAFAEYLTSRYELVVRQP